ncbi:HAD family phosphatase [candidate division KSB1 bacterium]|nr:HAD family phosphatase [candidate division KSB1 bacterium]
MSYKGIIFDFNGVLWLDSHLQECAWKQFSEAIRGSSFSDDEMREHVHGRNNRHTLEYLVDRPVSGKELDLLTEQKETIYRQMCLEEGPNFKLSPGAVKLLNDLVAFNIGHTIATASGKTNLDFFIEHFNLEKWFFLNQIVYDDGNRPGKPDPHIYLEAAARLNLAPVQCVVVEDSLSGIKAAHTAGVGYIIALGPVKMHDRLSRLKGVDRVITSLEKIRRVLV